MIEAIEIEICEELAGQLPIGKPRRRRRGPNRSSPGKQNFTQALEPSMMVPSRQACGRMGRGGGTLQSGRDR
jgi:hypothetical protein